MSKVFNVLLITIFVALGVFSWVYYITKQGTIALLVGGIMCIPTICIALILNKRKGKNKVTAKQYQDFALYLATNSQADKHIDKLLAYLSYTQDNTIDEKCAIYTKNSQQILTVKLFTVKPLAVDTLLNYIQLARTKQCDNVMFLTTAVEPTAYKIIDMVDDIKVKIVTANQLYDTMAECLMLPTIAKQKRTAITDSAILRYALSKARSKQYFWSGFVLLLLSRISFFPLYLMIWSTVLIALGLYSKFNKRYNNVPHQLPL